MRKNGFGSEHAFAANQYARERKYWLTQLSGNWTRSHFLYDYNKTDAEHSPTGKDTLRFMLPPSLCSQLMKLSDGSDPRLHMILLAGLVALLNRYTGDKDIIVGTTIYKPDVEGEFVNTLLPLRHQLENHMTFKDLLIQSRSTVLEAVKNVNYPMERLLYELNMSLNHSHFPLFDIALLLENIHDRNHLMNININMIVTFLRSGEHLGCTIEYNPVLYNPETAAGTYNHLSCLLHLALTNVNLPLVDLDILSETEKKQMVFDFNCTESGYPRNKTIHWLFEEQVGKTPDNIAVIHDDKQLTYRKLNVEANRLAWVLRARAVESGTLVAIMADHSIQTLVGILAVLKAGGAYLPIDLEYPPERIRYILKTGSIRLLLTRESLKNNVGFDGDILNLDDETLSDGDVNNPDNINNSRDPAYVIFTSGSTGDPKGVMVEHRGLVNYIKWAEKVYLHDQKYIFPLYSSLSFDLTVTSVYLPLISGNTIRVYHRAENEDVISKIFKENRVQVIKLTPTHLKIVKDLDIASSSIRKFIVGGEELTVSLAADIHKKFNGALEIYNEYGPTEAVVGCMLHRFDPGTDRGRSVPIGTPANNTRIYILDQNQNPVPPGAVGELHIAGAGLARGYINNPELTAQKFQIHDNRWFHRSYRPNKSYITYKTGDLARWLVGNVIEFLGRTDRQIKIRGYRVELAEIETRLLAYPGLEEAAVITKQDQTGDLYLCAYIVAPDGITPADLEAYLSGSVPDYMIPSYFIHLDAMPLTSNGKLDRNALPQPERKLTAKYVAPRDEIEEQMAKVWSEVLGIEKSIIGIDENFFRIGGHSLKATRLAVRIHREFNVEVPLLEVFKTPTIRGLSGYIKRAEKSRWTSVHSVEKKEYYPLSSSQKGLYILQQMDLESIAYNMPIFIPLRMDSGFDKKKLENIFRQLIQRHESLRTSFYMINEEPAQKVHNHVDFEIEYDPSLVIGQWSLENNQARGEDPSPIKVEESKQDFIQPFDLSQAPLLRARLVKLLHTPPTLPAHPSTEGSQNSFLLMVDMHHIITDGVSHTILEKEFTALYENAVLPPLRLQYKDFSLWQNRQLESGKLKKQEEYWLDKFKGHLPYLNLTTDYPRTDTVSREDIVYFKIAGQLQENIKKIVSRTGSTLFIFLLSVYSILLSKYTNREDIVVGCPAAARTHDDFTHIIGMFVNMVAIRNFPTPAKTFAEFFEEVKDNSIKAFENQNYQFEELVSKLEIPRHHNRNPLTETILVMQNIDPAPRENTAPRETKIPQPGNVDLMGTGETGGIAKFDIILAAVETQKEISLEFQYRSDLYKKETIVKKGQHLLNIIKVVVNNPEAKISEIEMLDKAETNELKKMIKNRFEKKGKSIPGPLVRRKMEAGFDF